jgi:hypothetical protein
MCGVDVEGFDFGFGFLEGFGVGVGIDVGVGVAVWVDCEGGGMVDVMRRDVRVVVSFFLGRLELEFVATEVGGRASHCIACACAKDLAGLSSAFLDVSPREKCGEGSRRHAGFWQVCRFRPNEEGLLTCVIFVNVFSPLQPKHCR